MAETPDSKKPKTEPLPSLRTFETDVTEVLKQQHTSAAQIVIAEQARPEEERAQTELPQKPSLNLWRNKAVQLITLIALGAGLLVFLAYVWFKPSPPPPAPVTASGQPIIGIDVEKNINVSGMTHQQIIDAIRTERDAATLRVNSTEGITFSKQNENGATQELDATDFASSIAPSLSASFIRSLDPGFAFGLIGLNGNQPFLVLRTGSYENAYSGILTSEIDLYREAGSVFVPGPGPLPALPTSTLAYYGTNAQLQVFQDTTIRNIDARVVRDSRGTIVFLYAFPDQATLVITTTPDTFEEIVQKLRRAQLIR